MKWAFNSLSVDVRVSQALHLKVLGSLDLLILIHFVLKTPLEGLESSVAEGVDLLVASGNALSPAVVSGNKFCVMSGREVTGWVFVATGSGSSDFRSDLGTTVFFEFFAAGSVMSGNVKDALHLIALLIAISLYIAIRVSVG